MQVAHASDHERLLVYVCEMVPAQGILDLNVLACPAFPFGNPETLWLRSQHATPLTFVAASLASIKRLHSPPACDRGTSSMLSTRPSAARTADSIIQLHRPLCCIVTHPRRGAALSRNRLRAMCRCSFSHTPSLTPIYLAVFGVARLLGSAAQHRRAPQVCCDRVIEQSREG